MAQVMARIGHASVPRVEQARAPPVDQDNARSAQAEVSAGGPADRATVSTAQAKTSPTYRALASTEARRQSLALEKERFEWEKARVAEELAYRIQMEEHRHQEALRVEENRARDSLARLRLQMAEAENDRRKIHVKKALMTYLSR
ncbi:hypothetical protein BZA05DRAFT_442765 [Tricharina praecox]|uniref:uncharacterized protein n=1 Tax=Tricharina praecox TaxID=43433 RepID=UPI0022201CFA|nr:uncharacterized protein BZA05DRAFT_442765 [Tricharina praecox]KAI5856106.1 hypothetical protein BZA05DRAFT_442765 [Tricharina praecox]